MRNKNSQRNDFFVGFLELRSAASNKIATKLKTFFPSENGKTEKLANKHRNMKQLNVRTDTHRKAEQNKPDQITKYKVK